MMTLYRSQTIIENIGKHGMSSLLAEKAFWKINSNVREL